MRNLIILINAVWTWNAIQGLNITEDAYQNKTKRGLVDQMHYYGDPNLVKYIQTPLYADVASSAASNPTATYYSTNQRPVIFHTPSASVKSVAETEPPKQVAVQQVHYEFQQTPHNAVSNVHVNQQFQPVLSVAEQRNVPDTIHSQTSIFPSQSSINPSFVNQPHILHVEPNQFNPVASPVQHGAVVHHGQAKLLYGPYPIAQTTAAPLPQPNGQPKYIYANGKILYQPLPINHGTNPYAGVSIARSHNINAPNNVGYQQRLVVTPKPFKASPIIPVTYNRYTPHSKLPVKTTESPVKEDIEEDSDDKSDAREEQDDEAENEEHSNYEEEEEDDYKPSHYSNKYVKYEDDDDEERENYKEQDDDEDEDSTRSYTRHVRKHPKKHGKGEGKSSGGKYHKNDHNSYKEGYKTSKKYSTEYKSPNTYYKYDSSSKKPKTHSSKSHKHYKTKSHGKQNKEGIESRQSQHIPIIHNKKIVQEKWLITKKNGPE